MTDDTPTRQLEPDTDPLSPSEFLATRQADLISRALDLASIAERAGDCHEAAVCRVAVAAMRHVLRVLDDS